MTVYLTVGEVLAIHNDLIVRYGGSHGVRDPGLLEAAVFRPQSGYYPALLAQAAALWESLAQNHPFVDGNKRVGFAVTYTFLSVNGFDIAPDAEEIFAFIDGLYGRGRFNAAQLEAWLRDAVVDRSNSL